MRPEQPPPDPDAPGCYLLRLTFIVALLCVLYFVSSSRAHAVQLSAEQCQELAVWASDTIWAYHVGADKEKVRAYYREQRNPIFPLLLRDFDKIWGLDLRYREPMYSAVLTACNNRRGVYPDET